MFVRIIGLALMLLGATSLYEVYTAESLQLASSLLTGIAFGSGLLMVIKD